MNNEPATLREIAEEEGISHQAVAEILQRAFRKFKKAIEDKNIKIEDLL